MDDKGAGGNATTRMGARRQKSIGWRACTTTSRRGDGRSERHWVHGETRDEVMQKLHALKSELREADAPSPDAHWK